MLICAGVPFDVAWAMEPNERLAYLVVKGISEGREWDFRTMRWVVNE